MLSYLTGVVKSNRNQIVLLAFSLIACLYIMFCITNIFAAAALIISCVFLYAFYKNIDTSFWLYTIILPFSYIPFINSLPMGITANKLLFLLLAVFLFLFLMFKKPYKLSMSFYFFLFIILIFYSIAWLRSASYALWAFSDSFVGELPVSRYLIDYVSWTFLAGAPLLVIAFFYQNKNGIEKVIRIMALSIVLLIGYLIFIFVFKVGNKNDFEVVRTQFGYFSGMNGNDIANYCILSFPVILAWALNKKSFISFFTVAAIAAGTVISFSRTAYILVIFGFFLYLFLTKKLKWIPIIVAVLAITLNFMLPEVVVDRATMGISGISEGNYDEFSSGRIDYIWQPLINELKSKPKIILFGSGRFGITNTDAWKQGRVSLYYHAHNMYLDCILDMGIVGLVVFMAFFIFLIIHFLNNSTRYKDSFPYYSNLIKGCIVSLICYLISGMSGRTFFPNIANVNLWIVIGLGIAICGYVKELRDENGEMRIEN